MNPQADGMTDHHLGGEIVRIPLLQLPLEGLEKNRRDRRRNIVVSNRRVVGFGEIWSHRQRRRAINMAKDLKTIKYPLDCELLRKVVGVVKHHIGMVDVPPYRIYHVVETVPGTKKRAAQRDRKP